MASNLDTIPTHTGSHPEIVDDEAGIRAALATGKPFYFGHRIHCVSLQPSGRVEGQCDEGCCEWQFDSVDEFIAFLFRVKEIRSGSHLPNTPATGISTVERTGKALAGRWYGRSVFDIAPDLACGRGIYDPADLKGREEDDSE